MRRNQPDIKAPRPIIARSRRQPVASTLGHCRIVFGVLAIAGANVVAQHPRRHLDPFFFASDRRPDHTDAASHLHRDMFNIETCWVLVRTVVQLANAFDRHAFFLQRMTPTFGVACVWHGIVPKPRLVHLLSGGKRRAGRYADRRGRVGIGKAHAACGQRVKVQGSASAQRGVQRSP